MEKEEFKILFDANQALIEKKLQEKFKDIELKELRLAKKGVFMTSVNGNLCVPFLEFEKIEESLFVDAVADTVMRYAPNYWALSTNTALKQMISSTLLSHINNRIDEEFPGAHCTCGKKNFVLHLPTATYNMDVVTLSYQNSKFKEMIQKCEKVGIEQTVDEVIDFLKKYFASSLAAAKQQIKKNEEKRKRERLKQQNEEQKMAALRKRMKTVISKNSKYKFDEKFHLKENGFILEYSLGTFFSTADFEAAAIYKNDRFVKYDADKFDQVALKWIKKMDSKIETKLVSGLRILSIAKVPSSFYTAIRKLHKEIVKERNVKSLDRLENNLYKKNQTVYYRTKTNGYPTESYALSNACYTVYYENKKPIKTFSNDWLEGALMQYETVVDGLVTVYKRYNWSPLVDELLYVFQNNDFMTTNAVLYAVRGKNYSITVNTKIKGDKKYSYYNENQIMELIRSMQSIGIVQEVYRSGKKHDYYALVLMMDWLDENIIIKPRRTDRQIISAFLKGKSLTYDECLFVLEHYKKTENITIEVYVNLLNMIAKNIDIRHLKRKECVDLFKNAPKEIKKVIEMKVSVAENSDVKKVYREIIKAIKDFEKLEEL